MPAGQVLCEYSGTQLGTTEAMRLEDKSYLMRLGPEDYVDAREDVSVLARFINDCCLAAVYNVVFEKRPGEGRALVVATRPICAGEARELVWLAIFASGGALCGLWQMVLGEFEALQV